MLKVLSLAQKEVGDSPEKLQETAKWLLSQQQADGSFQDPCPVLHRGMQVRARGLGRGARVGAVPAPHPPADASFPPEPTRGAW